MFCELLLQPNKISGLFQKTLFFFTLLLVTPFAKSQILIYTGSQALTLIERKDSIQMGMEEFFEKTETIDTNYFFYKWDNNNVHLDSVDLSDITDTIYLKLISSVAPHFVLPIEGDVVDNFHWRKYRHHNGLDIRLKTGDTVYAAFDGIVRYAQYNTGGYGNLVVLRHFNMLETYYGHFSKILVQPDAFVKAGTPIGLGGSTGRSTGPHLHFEVRYLGNAIDPEKIIDWECGSLTGYELTLHQGFFKHKKEQQQRSYYKVRSGDTLTSIARKNGTTVQTLCRLNGLKQTSVIRIGQTLRVN